MSTLRGPVQLADVQGALRVPTLQSYTLPIPWPIVYNVRTGGYFYATFGYRPLEK